MPALLYMALLCLYLFCAPFSLLLAQPIHQAAAKLEDTPPKVPLGLPAISWPDDNPYSSKKAELGKLLFFDKRLSSDASVSCASCHMPTCGFADNKPISAGIGQQLGSRNSPTIINCAYQQSFFWDGRAASIEEQIKGPLANPKEMTLAKTPSEAYRQCQNCIASKAGYRRLFKEAFGNEDCSIDNIAKAIATFERTILSGNSAYDRYVHGDKNAMTPQQIEGLRIFKKVGCANCHGGPNFTDGRFMNIGVGMDKENPDLGRFEITKNTMHKGAFKTPTLREVSKSAPYMHDGSLKTLAEVIDYYDKGGIPNPYLSPMMKALHLSAQEKQALVSFLEALDGEGWQHVQEPVEFPQ